jgi:hypothetical protein
MKLKTLMAAFFGGSLIFSVPAGAVTLFNNPLDASGAQTFWCDPCSSGNTGFRVWDSFTLANDSSLTGLRWLGLRTDPMTLGAVVEIANAPFGADLFSTSFASGSISRTDTGVNSSINIVSLPNVVLGAGTYWLTVHGPSILEQFTWLGQFETPANGDNSLIQFGPDPDNPTLTLPRNMDARFSLSGDLIVTPLPAALPLFASGLGVMGLLGWRRKRKLRFAA